MLAGFQRESAGSKALILAVIASQPAMSASSSSEMASRPSARNSNSEAVRVIVTVSVDLVLYADGILFPFVCLYESIIPNLEDLATISIILDQSGGLSGQ